MSSVTGATALPATGAQPAAPPAAIGTAGTATPTAAVADGGGSQAAIGVDQLVPVLQGLVSVLTQLIGVIQAQLSASAVQGGGGAQGAPADAGCGMAGCGGGSPVQQTGGAAGAPDVSATADEQQRADKAAQQKASKNKQPAGATQAYQGPQNLVSGGQKHSVKENALVVADVAQKLGVDPVLAVADMLTESGGNNTNATGDGGTSFGLFQLHVNGELPKDWYPGKPNHDKAFDPRENAQVALSRFAALKNKYSGASLAYHAQRPADQAGYERAVNSHMDEARKLLGL